jgi:mannose-6-phosphate isomerase-like protein (cupin superfamily)
VKWDTASVRNEYDVIAPDGSEIRLLVQTERGSMVHCTLAIGQVTAAVRHQTVDEVWYCLAGEGEVWRRDGGGHAEVVTVTPGVALSIPVGVAFQFSATGTEPLQLLITTMPPWPGGDEALPVDGAWTPTT